MGNFLIGAATLIYIGMLTLIYGSHPRSGEYGVGYAWILILANFGFVLCLAIVTGIIGSKGGFSWVSSDSAFRFVLVLAGFIVVMTGNTFFSFGEGMEDLPPFVRQIFRYVPAVLPLLLLGSAAILLNDGWRSALPSVAYKLPLTIALAFGAFAIGLILMHSAHNATSRMQAESDFEKRNHQNYLDNIDAADMMKEMAFILGYTDANHYTDVRERALAKIKSRPDWQEELVRYLKTDWAPDVFTFLASNDVDNKAMFPEPVREGLLIQAKLIREEIRKASHPSHLYSDQFFWQVERALRTADKFTGMGTDFRPAVEEMQKALDEPCDLEKPKFRCSAQLDDWLEKHG